MHDRICRVRSTYILIRYATHAIQQHIIVYLRVIELEVQLLLDVQLFTALNKYHFGVISEHEPVNTPRYLKACNITIPLILDFLHSITYGEAITS